MGKLYLICGDYIKGTKSMDAIVNPANEYMEPKDDINKIIYENAGIEQLMDYCQENMPTKMESTEVRITPGFNLSSDIIHVLSPEYKKEEDSQNKLLKTYKNLLLE